MPYKGWSVSHERRFTTMIRMPDDLPFGNPHPFLQKGINGAQSGAAFLHTQIIYGKNVHTRKISVNKP